MTYCSDINADWKQCNGPQIHPVIYLVILPDLTMFIKLHFPLGMADLSQLGAAAEELNEETTQEVESNK